MDDPLLMNGVESARDLSANLGHLGRREAPEAFQESGQTAAFHHLHRQEMPAGDFVHIIDPADVGVGHPAGDADLAQEMLEYPGLSAKIRRKELERHRLTQLQVLGVVDLTHPPTAQGSDDPVAIGEVRAGNKAVGNAVLHPHRLSIVVVGLTSGQLTVQPGLGMTQFAGHRGFRDVLDFHDLLVGHPGEIELLDDPGRLLVFLSQEPEGVVKGHKLRGALLGEGQGFVEGELLHPSAAFLGQVLARPVDEDAPHLLSGDAEEVSPDSASPPGAG